METKKIIEVLEFIHKYCKSRELCKHCKLHNGEYCSLNDADLDVLPELWSISLLKANLRHIERID